MKKLIISVVALLASLTCFAGCAKEDFISPVTSSTESSSSNSETSSTLSSEESSVESNVESSVESSVESNVESSEESSVESSDESSSESSSIVEEDPLADAAEYLEDMYRASNKETRSDYEVVSSVFGYEITWSVDVEDIEIEQGSGNTKTVIKVSGLSEDVTYVLTATISDGEGNTKTVEFTRVALAALDKIPQAISQKPAEDTPYKLYVYQSTKATDCYFTGEMSGYYFATTDVYEGTPDLYVEYIEGTDNFNVYFDKAGVKTYIGVRLSDDGAHNNVVMDTTPPSAFFWNAEIGTICTHLDVDKDGKASDFYLGNYSTHMTFSASTISYAGGAGNNVGGLVEMVSKDSIAPEIKIAAVKEVLSVQEEHKVNKTVALTTSDERYPDVEIDWTLSESDYASLLDNELTLNIPAEAETITLTATLTCGDFTDTKVFELTIGPAIATPTTEEEIVNAAYSLATNETLPGTYTLTGIITKVNTAYDASYQNVTVTIVVDGMTDKAIECYRLKGEGADAIKVGDTITVTGTLKNYNGKVEFDQGCTLDSYVPGQGGEVIPGAATLTFDDLAKRTSQNDDIQVWEENGVKLTNNKHESRNPINGQYYNPVRLYANTNVVIEYAGMTKLVFVCNTAYQPTANLVDSIGTMEGVTVSSDDTVVTVEFASAQDSFTFVLVAQVRLESLTVYSGTVTPPDSSDDSSSDDSSVDSSTDSSSEDSSSEAPTPSVTVTAPVEGVAYLMYLEQLTNGTTLYLTGKADSEKPQFLGATANASEAAYVYVDAAEGGYKFYVLGEDNVKSYIALSEYLSGNYYKASISWAAEGTVFHYESVGCWAATLENDTYFIGTYSTYATVSASSSYYMTQANMGTTQFPLLLVEASEGGEDSSTDSSVDSSEDSSSEDSSSEAPVPVAGGSADFNTIVTSNPNGNSSYLGPYTTTNGWVVENAAIQTGGSSVSNPQFPVIGENNTFKAVCLNGKVGAAGVLTSPTLTGGISKLTINYTKMFTDTMLGFTVTITDLTTNTVYTKEVSVELPKDEKYVVYNLEWVLETAIAGDFTIVIENTCPSNNSSNKDRVTLLSVAWDAPAEGGDDSSSEDSSETPAPTYTLILRDGSPLTGFTMYEEYQYAEGATLELPELTAEGKTFLGWFDINDNAAPATMPAEAIALMAKWEITPYTLTIKQDGAEDKTFTFGIEYTTGIDISVNDLATVLEENLPAGYVYLETIPETFTLEDYTFTVANVPVASTPDVSQGNDRTEMPTYAGDVTALGFAAGTTVYELALTPDTAWADRTVMSVDSTKDYVKFNVVFSVNIGTLTLWPGGDGTTFGSYALSATGASTSDADPNRRVFIVDQDGYLATAFNANTLYTIYFYLNGDEVNVQLSTWSNVTIYFGNIECADGDVTPLVPVMPNIFTQDKAAGLPVYKGDVTALGFAEGTDVMVNTAAGNTWNDGAYFDTDETTNCLTVRFAYATVPAGEQFMIHMWGSEIGYIARISDGEVWHNAGDTVYREVVLLDANGNPVTELQANTVYTLKIYHNGATAIAICPIGNNYSVYCDNAIVENNDEYVAPHVHSYDAVVTPPTCTEPGYTTYTCECEDTYTEPGDAATGVHVDEDANYKCDVCTKLVEPADGETLTIAQAIALAKALGTGKYSTNSYTLIVEVVSVYNTTYGNMNVTDDNGDAYVLYGTYLGSYDPNNKTANRYDSLTYKPVTGDILTVCGKVGSYSSGSISYQIQNAVITNIEVHTCQYTEATCKAPATCTLCQVAQEGSTTVEHVYEEGACKWCGKEEGSTYNVYAYDFTAKVFSANGTQSLGGVNWTIAGDGGYWGYDSQNGKGQQLGSSGSPYKSLTVTSESFSNVSNITINTSGASSIIGSCKVYVGDTLVETITLTKTATNYSFDVSGLSGEIKLEYTQTSSKAIYIKSISVTYAE